MILRQLTSGQNGEARWWILIAGPDVRVRVSVSMGGSSLEKEQVVGSDTSARIFRGMVSSASSEDIASRVIEMNECMLEHRRHG